MGEKYNEVDYLKILNDKIEVDSKNPKLYMMRANYYIKLRKFEEAYDDTKKALLCEDGDMKTAANLYNIQAEFFLEKKDYENAAEKINRAMYIHKKIQESTKELVIDPKTLMLRGRLLMGKGKWGEAYKTLEIAKEHAEKGHLQELFNYVVLLLADCMASLKDETDRIGQQIIKNEPKKKSKSKKKAQVTKDYKKPTDVMNSDNSGEKSDNKPIEVASSSVIEDPFHESTEVEDVMKLSAPIFEKREYKFEYWISKVDICYGVYEAHIPRMVFQNDKFVSKKIVCSMLEVSDVSTAYYQQFISELLDEDAVKVIFIDGSSVILEEIKSDIHSWYIWMYRNFKGNRSEWWKYIENNLKKLFRGIFKSLSKLYPCYSHGNWIKGIAVFDGQGKLYNMKYTGNKGYMIDFQNLHQMIIAILMRSSPEEFEDLNNIWTIVGQKSKSFYENLCSNEFGEYMLQFLNIIEGEKNGIFYVPFFWDHEERTRFLERVYDIFWTEKNTRAACIFDHYFDSSWKWWTLVPPYGPLRKTFEHMIDQSSPKSVEGENEVKNVGGKKTEAQTTPRCVDSIRFWRNCRYHYNTHLDDNECFKTVKEIEVELDARLFICFNVFRAASKAINKSNYGHNHDFLIERLIPLLDVLRT